VLTPRLRYRDLLALGIVRNRPTLQNWIRDRGFPRGQLTGPNSRTWGEDEVRAWVAKRPTRPKPIPPVKPGKRRGRPRKAASAARAARFEHGASG
jgi:predicted DNA-binding transcriptional regulator AlpA